MRIFGTLLLLACLAMPALADDWPACRPVTYTLGSCAWAGAYGGPSTVTVYQYASGYFCRASIRLYSWYPAFDRRKCSVNMVQAGRCKPSPAIIGNHVIRQTRDGNIDRVRLLERNLYACLSGHDLP